MGGMFVAVLAYALLFDKLGFVISTADEHPAVALFGGTWKQSLLAARGSA